MTRKHAKVRVLFPSLQKDTAASPFRFTGKCWTCASTRRRCTVVPTPAGCSSQFDTLQSDLAGGMAWRGALFGNAARVDFDQRAVEHDRGARNESESGAFFRIGEAFAPDTHEATIVAPWLDEI